MEYRFQLNDLVIEEPRGWADFEQSIKRDEKAHGMQFEASTGTLEFYGAGAEYLATQKELYGIKASVTFLAEVACDNEFEEAYRGRLNFGKYKRACGLDCRVQIPVEEESCQVIFKSRFDQKVDLDSLTAFDGLTVLPNYTNMGQEIEIPAKTLLLEDEANQSQQVVEELTASPEWHTTTGPDTIQATLLPAFNNTVSSSFGTFNPSPFPQLFAGGNPQVIPDLPPTIDSATLLGSIECGLDETEVEYRLKGHVYLQGSNTLATFQIQIWKERDGVYNQEYIWNNPSPGVGGLTLFVYLNDPAGWNNAGWPREMDFDVSDAFSLPDIQQGDKLWFFVRPFSSTFANIDLLTWTQDPESYFKTSTKAVCEPSNAKAYLIHETISRVTEAVTNRCMRAKSEYYGRIDSEPFAFDSDGCGGLRMLTSGLKIRRAPEDKFFASPKDLLEGLYGIDNIGFGVEDDSVFTGKSVLRVEPVDYFYQDDEILSHPSIPRAEFELQEGQHYSRILIGFPNWTVEQVNGLGEINSTREYRTSLETINNTIDLQSQLVTGSYPIEITRQQSFAATGAADTKYDNNIFLICLLRNAYGFIIEQGGITDPDNIFDPDTVMNYRLSPVRNLMRWYKSLINSYVNLNSTESKLFFSAGTGNLTAEGEITEGTYDQFCKLENMVIREDQNLFITHFERVADATPLWKPETITYEYPMSVADYRLIKAKPYGYISFQCGNGDFQKGFINEVKYRMARGVATFNLKIKW